jgi:hypothetical protein
MFLWGFGLVLFPRLIAYLETQKELGPWIKKIVGGEVSGCAVENWALGG